MPPWATRYGNVRYRGDKSMEGGRCTCHAGIITGFRRLEFGGLTKHQSDSNVNKNVDLVLPSGFEGVQNTRIFVVGGFDAAKLRGCSSVVTWAVASL
jgi:hypothetical protein